LGPFIIGIGMQQPPPSHTLPAQQASPGAPQPPPESVETLTSFPPELTSTGLPPPASGGGLPPPAGGLSFPPAPHPPTAIINTAKIADSILCMTFRLPSKMEGSLRLRGRWRRRRELSSTEKCCYQRRTYMAVARKLRH